MRTGGLTDRIADSFGRGIATTRQQARLVDDLARALKETADTASSIRPAPSKLELEERERDQEPAAGMPQVLKSMAVQAGYALAKPDAYDRWLSGREWWRLRRSLLSPAGSALGIGILVISALSAVVELAGLRNWSPPSEQQAAAGMRTLVSTSDFAQRPGERTVTRFYPTLSDPVPAPVFSAEDDLLLARSAALIARGDILGARSLLARAASDGSFAARFALAETFDPNTLAAWGSRDPLADVVLARRLYEQALAAGDARAARRIEAMADAQ